MSRYLDFREVPFPGKTKKYDVLSQTQGTTLGRIAWFGRWRQYVFIPEPDTVFNGECLGDIRQFLAALMAERRKP